LLLFSHRKKPDPDVASELAVASEPLSFTALKALTPDVARELAAHRGSLELDAVAELLPATAAILVKHEGALSLKSAEPGDESLLVLSAYRGRLELGLTIVSEAPPQIPARPAGHLRLSAASEETQIRLTGTGRRTRCAQIDTRTGRRQAASSRKNSGNEATEVCVCWEKTRRNDISQATAHETLPDSVPDTVSALQQCNYGDSLLPSHQHWPALPKKGNFRFTASL
jgi:hypothetical protein